MTMSGYLRGQIAKMANLNMENLRYYEDLGIISAPLCSESGYRLYSEEVLIQLNFILNAKSCGFTLKEIQKALQKSKSGQLNIEAFIAVIDKKMYKIHSETQILTRQVMACFLYGQLNRLHFLNWFCYFSSK